MSKTRRSRSRSRRREADGVGRSQTLPSSPSHSSSSSSDFEFTLALSPCKSSSNICHADELFYKGQLLPLHLSPRLSMFRTLLLTSPTSSSSSDTSRDSTGSSNSSISSDLVLLAELDSARPSSVAEEEDELKRFNNQHIKKPSSKYFSFSRLSSVFRKSRDQDGAVKKTSSSLAKQVVRKYLKKVKPLYEKLSQKQEKKVEIAKTLVKSSSGVPCSVPNTVKSSNGGVFSNSFSGNIRYLTRRRCVSSCPSSMRSSPSRSFNAPCVGSSASNSSTMEELQSAIQGAIIHCKNSMGGSKQEFGVNEQGDLMNPK